jgi:hypothetical protein
MKKLTLILLLTVNFGVFAQNNSFQLKLNDSINLNLEKSDFKLMNEKIGYYKSFPVTINDKIIFGTDRDLPKSKLKKAILNIGGKIIRLEIDGMYNPWFGNEINKNLIKFVIENDFLKLKILFSDGAGSYLAEWIIFKNSSTRTILSNEEDIIVNQFY